MDQCRGLALMPAGLSHRETLPTGDRRWEEPRVQTLRGILAGMEAGTNQVEPTHSLYKLRQPSSALLRRTDSCRRLETGLPRTSGKTACGQSQSPSIMHC